MIIALLALVLLVVLIIFCPAVVLAPFAVASSIFSATPGWMWAVGLTAGVAAGIAGARRKAR